MKMIVVFLTCIIAAVSAFACCEHRHLTETNLIPPEKIYILPDHLHVSDKAIFVFLSKTWQQFDTLFSDENGVFVYKNNPKLWYCGKCSTHHNCDENCPKTGRNPPASCDR